jgi:hypothetical protein
VVTDHVDAEADEEESDDDKHQPLLAGGQVHG